jgi:peptidoglycan/LPS O-acetylase OafA/YrhL
MNGRERHWDVLRALLLFIIINEHVLRAVYGVAVNPEVQYSANSLWADTVLLFSPITLLYNGAAAVSVMFVLSGYLVSRSAFKFNSIFFYPALALSVKRYARLVIPVVAALFIHYLITNLGLAFSGDASRLMGLSFGFNAFSEIALDDVFYQGFVSTPLLFSREHIPLLWIVAVELYMSVFLIVICGLTHHKYFTAKTKLIIGMGLAMLLIVFSYNEIILGFLLGHAIAVCERYKALSLSRWAKVGVTLGLILSFSFVQGGGAGAFFNWLGVGVHQLDWKYIVYAYGGACLILLIKTSAGLRSALQNRLLAMIGIRSYSVLLVHLTVMVSLGYFVYMVLPNDGDIKFIGLVLSTYIGSLLLGVVLYQYIEKPLLNRLAAFSVPQLFDTRQISCPGQ